MNEAEQKTLFADLDNERVVHPLTQPEDMLKFLFQGLCGPGHLLASRAEIVRRICSEYADLLSDDERKREERQADCPAFEDRKGSWSLTFPMGSRYLRLSLPAAAENGLNPEQIAAMMQFSDPPADSREEVIRASDLYADRLPPEQGALLRRLSQSLRNPEVLPSHSSVYRTAYAPSYRIISRTFEPLLPVISYIAKRTRDGGIVAIDGPCASGKTTLAARLASVLNARIVHTDDYVVPHRKKTPDRLAVPGGNCDAERLLQEVLVPFSAGRECCVRPYDCHADKLLPGKTLSPGGILILEGSYSLLPAFRELIKAEVFVSAPLEVRLRRLAERESPESLERFKSRWIPLEENYFRAYHLPNPECFRFDTVE